MRYKKYIIILLIAIVLFFSLTFIYNKLVVNNDYIYAYVSNISIDKGENLNLENVDKVKIQVNNYEDIFNDFENLELYVFVKDIKKGKIILKEDLKLKSEYKIDEEYEYISLKAESSDMVVSYSISRGDIVNIYYTAKTDMVTDILERYSEDFITSGVGENYATIKLLKNITVYDTFNNSGISLNNSLNLNGDLVIDTVMIKVKKEDALLIKNLKHYGKFSFSKVKWGYYMNLLVIKDENSDLNDLVDNLEKYYLKNQGNYDLNLRFLEDRKTKAKIDEILIISNDINFIEENFYSFENKKRILIITNNFDAKHVLACLLLTENLFSAKKDEVYIINKIFDVYKNNRSAKEFSNV